MACSASGCLLLCACHSACGHKQLACTHCSGANSLHAHTAHWHENASQVNTHAHKLGHRDLDPLAPHGNTRKHYTHATQARACVRAHTTPARGVRSTRTHYRAHVCTAPAWDAVLSGSARRASMRACAPAPINAQAALVTHEGLTAHKQNRASTLCANARALAQSHQSLEPRAQSLEPKA